MTLSFAWWNVGLKPPVAGQPEPADSSVLKPWFMFCHLDEILKLDFIAFGEVSDQFVKNIAKPFVANGYLPISATGKEGRLIFDVGIFYKADKLELIECRNIFFPHYSGSLKVATRLDFNSLQTGERIYFYVSHWPSRLSRPDVGRDELGTYLRMDIQSVFDEEGISAKIILLGDYNDEPFDKPIYDKLVATRDRRLILEKPYILYNPFWRSLGGYVPYGQNKKLSPCHGTYYYKGSKHVTKWFTFDQIMVSSAFMGHSQWHLDEELTRAFSYDESSLLGTDFFKEFDHLPIYGRVVR